MSRGGCPVLLPAEGDHGDLAGGSALVEHQLWLHSGVPLEQRVPFLARCDGGRGLEYLSTSLDGHAGAGGQVVIPVRSGGSARGRGEDDTTAAVGQVAEGSRMRLAAPGAVVVSRSSGMPSK